MQKELGRENALEDGQTKPHMSDRTTLRTPKTDPRVIVDIVAIGAAPFHHHLKKKGSEVFLTSLYKID